MYKPLGFYIKPHFLIDQKVRKKSGEIKTRSGHRRPSDINFAALRSARNHLTLFPAFLQINTLKKNIFGIFVVRIRRDNRKAWGDKEFGNPGTFCLLFGHKKYVNQLHGRCKEPYCLSRPSPGHAFWPVPMTIGMVKIIAFLDLEQTETF